MNRAIIILAVLLFANACAASGGFPEGVYVAPDGRADGDGSYEAPVSVEKAVRDATPGTTLCLMPGVYRLDCVLDVRADGTAAAPIVVKVCGEGRAVLDGSAIEGNGPCVRMPGSYWHLADIDLTGAPGGGATITGSHNLFERCSAHHTGGTGFSIGLVHGDTTNAYGERAAYNVFINCDAYMNYDWRTHYRGKYSPGTHADGFGCKLRSGRGNKFHGCRAWSNSDDNWDLFESGGGVEIVDCWNWRAGVWSDFVDMHYEKTGEKLTPDLFDGNGNGFKLGGNHVWTGEAAACDNKSLGLNVLRNSISFGNTVKGIDQNNHQDGTVVENCLVFDNGVNIRYWKEPNAGKTYVFRNNIIFGRGGNDPQVDVDFVSEGNSWDRGLRFTCDDFVSLREADAAAPRRKDGSLPDRFGRLRKGSPAVDAGVPTTEISSPRDNIDLPQTAFGGKAPDLGPYELN